MNEHFQSEDRRILPLGQQKISRDKKALYLLLEVPRKDWGLPSGEAIAFAHALTVPEGPFVNQPLRLRPFQMQFIRDVYNPRRPDGRRKRRQAVMSIGRRGGKTLLAAVVVLLHLAGPFKRPNSTMVSAATTRKQAKIVYRYVWRMVWASRPLRRRLKVIASTNVITRRDDFSSYSAIAAEAGGQYGEGLDLVVYDELAQAKNAALYDALMTSLGSQVEPLMMIISTQAPADDHILSELIDYGLKIQGGEIDDETFTVHLYAAAENCALLDEKEWLKANPALGDYRDIEEMRATMNRAVKVPSLESRMRNLYLNQRVQAKAPFLTPNVWRLGERPVSEELFYSGRPVYGGLDLSARTDLSACVLAVEDDSGAIHLLPRIWTPADNLAERALRDRAPYEAWANAEWLIPVPGLVLDYDFLAADIGEISSKVNFACINYDAWRIDIMRQSLDRLGLAVPLAGFGQGYKSMSPAIEAFEELAIAGKIVHGGHPVLRWCVSNAVIEMDAAGNRKLTKARSFGRIDAAVAAIMAVAAAKISNEPGLDIEAIVA